MKFILIFVLVLLCGCNGSIGKSTSNTTVDNSTDNSNHGIAFCSDGSTVKCRPDGSEFAVTHECRGPSDEVLVVEGPDFTPIQPDNCDTTVATSEGFGSTSSETTISAD